MEPYSLATNAVEVEPEVSQPVETQPEPVDIRAMALTGLLLLAVGYTLYFARVVLLPIVIALFFYFLLNPLIKFLKTLYIPAALGAAVVIFTAIGLLGGGVYYLLDPATTWLEQMPESMRQLEKKLRPLQQSVQEVSQATQEVEKITQVAGGGTEQKAVKVNVERQSLADFMLNATSSFIAGLVAMLILLYFLLASGNLFLLKLVRVLPRLQDKKKAVTIVNQVEHDISIYMVTVTLINAGLGIATALLMLLLGMPNPILWGVVAGILNFVPYVSSVITTVLLGVAAFLTFDNVGRAVLVPGAYIVLNSLEGFVITPLVHSQRFTLNAVAIIIWLAFWSWLWGVAGTLLAMPILVTFKILCDQVESLAPIREFLE